MKDTQQRFMSFAEHADGRTGPQRIAVTVDVSKSMDEPDYSPTRLGAACEAIMAMVLAMSLRYPEDEVGIVCFSSGAYVALELTAVGVELKAIRQAVGQLVTESSTNITAGLKTAGELLGALSGGLARGPGLIGWLSRVIYQSPVQAQPVPTSAAGRIILLSDGAHNFGSRPDGVARKLKKAGVCIDVIGIGGSPQVVDPHLPDLASLNADGSPRYCFIGDKGGLIRAFENLANRIRPA